ncbi:mandelate racemase [Actibacterium mucosum KCTC 23349]|uniref:Mandelate racemase n=1 Tax=Actibacterium mucosum KCTC 23349 TaxID=1454373 RepID=A0A037ZIL3_9RHOB|nr:mandelate racemase/muconate lactonizing enzyme family protein [Actibacterium mucosum]KAJ56285.1 mandelate racemase [Actibacterium mucosum KCTC 23349]
MIEIARIQAWAFRSPTKRPVATSFGVMHDRPAVLIRVEDRDGVFGWGEAFANWPAAGAEHRVRLLQMDIAQLVLNKPAATPAEFFHQLADQTRIRAVQCGEVGPFSQVLAGLDIAIWDLAARRAGLPLRKFIRQDAADQVPAYASGIQINAAAEILPAARMAGHQRFKVKVGFNMPTDIALVHDVQTDLSGEETLACDANQAWNLEQACAFVDGVAGLPLHWLEEPMPVFTDRTKWQELARQSSIPLAGGENIIGVPEFGKAIDAGHLSVVQPDVAKWGGITGCLAVAQQALRAGRRYCPHFLGAGIGLVASAELLAGVGGDGQLEVDFNANPLRTMFLDGEKEPIIRGAWQCSDKPGLGVEALPNDITQFQTLHVDLC